MGPWGRHADHAHLRRVLQQALELVHFLAQRVLECREERERERERERVQRDV